MLRFLPIVIIVAAIAIGFWGGGGEAPPDSDKRGWLNPRQDGGTQRRPRYAPRQGDTDRWKPGDKSASQGGSVLPPPSRRDPQVQVQISPDVTNSTGTAFAIARNGIWMTARHVVDGCGRLYLLTAPRQGMKVRRVYVHPTADVAILKTDRGVQPLRFSGATLRRDQDGFHMGYPAGKPGDVNSRLIGRSVLHVRGRYSTSEPVIAWAERHRVPDTWGGLGGISGGPAFDGNGRIIGVNVAGSKRRGRVFTAAPLSLRRAMERASFSPPSSSLPAAASIDRQNFATIGNQLRKTLQVAKVLCFAPQGRRRRFR